MVSGYIDRGATHSQTLNRLEAIIATAMDAIISIDATERIICFNPAAEQMFGISVRDVMGSPLERFIPERFRKGHHHHIAHFTETGQTGRRMGALGAVSALRANGEEFPAEASISQTTTGHEQIATVILRDITERKASEEAQALLTREVDHRAKNILAMVSSLVTLTQASTLEEYAESLSGRIAAMSRAHSLLAHHRWKGTALHDLANDELGTYAEPPAYECRGPDLKLNARSVQPVGMLLHELATNAVKHGALSVREGRVSLIWSRTVDEKIQLVWRESGGPPASPPSEFGFGTSLIQQIVENQLCGKLEHSWSITGYSLKLTLPEAILQLGPERPTAGTRPLTEERGKMRTSPAPKDENFTGTLMIVEDEPLLAMQMARSLKDHGWTILGVAGSVEEANRLLGERRRPDVAILDVDLAGMPVFPLARSLRRLGVPFLFCTGYEDLEFVHEFSTCRSIRKPATVLQIVRGLREVIRDNQAVMAPIGNR